MGYMRKGATKSSGHPCVRFTPALQDSWLSHGARWQFSTSRTERCTTGVPFAGHWRRLPHGEGAFLSTRDGASVPLQQGQGISTAKRDAKDAVSA